MRAGPETNKAGLRRPCRTPREFSSLLRRSPGEGGLPSCRYPPPRRLQLGARMRCMDASCLSRRRKAIINAASLAAWNHYVNRRCPPATRRPDRWLALTQCLRSSRLLAPARGSGWRAGMLRRDRLCLRPGTAHKVARVGGLHLLKALLPHPLPTWKDRCNEARPLRPARP